MYSYHKCRCIPCAAANREYYHATAHLTRTKKWADAELARKRILQLRAAGLTMDAMAEMTAVHVSTLHYILNGPGGRTVKRILTSTLDALNAISYKDIAGRELTSDTRVDGVTPRLQTMALQAAGWCTEDLSKCSGVGKQTFNRLMRGLGTTEEMRGRIDSLYRELHRTTPPQDTPLQQMRVRRALRRAEANGWTTDMAEDLDYAAAS
jgi:lambda repressor-like predicted transcriptional regulator